MIPASDTSFDTGTDAMRAADGPHGWVILLPHESPDDYKDLKYPGVRSFQAGRTAAKLAYKHAGIAIPLEELETGTTVFKPGPGVVLNSGSLRWI